MKLYAEEDMKKAFWEGHTYAASIVPASMGWQDRYVQNTIDSFTPIELPSDEEMEKELLEHTKVSTIDPYKSFYFNAAMFGAKWVIEQIKQQDK